MYVQIRNNPLITCNLTFTLLNKTKLKRLMKDFDCYRSLHTDCLGNQGLYSDSVISDTALNRTLLYNKDAKLRLVNRMWLFGPLLTF